PSNRIPNTAQAVFVHRSPRGGHLNHVSHTDPVREALLAAQNKKELVAVDNKWCPDFIETDTGNCSIGVSAAKAMIGAVAGNTGGEGLVNPVIASKNLGDYLMAIPQAIWMGSKV